MQYTIGIDIGTTAVKVVLLSGEGNLAAEASVGYDLISLHQGWAEENALIWWESAAKALRDLLSQNMDKRHAIKAIGVSGMVPALVLLDEHGQPVRNTIQQNDARAFRQVERLRGEIPQQALFARTGGFTNLQHVLPRLMWVMENEPAVWANCRTVMGSYDYIVFRLTGKHSIERNWAAESGLYDIYTETWLYELFDRYNLCRDYLPKVNPSMQTVGVTTPHMEAETLLPPGIPVIAGSADHVASTLSAGIISEGDLLIKFGGGGDVLYCTNEIRPCADLFFDYHIVPGKYLVNGCMAASGSVVKWYTKDVLHLDSPEVFREFDEAAANIAAGSDGLIVLPYFLGEKTPLFDPSARGVMLGLTLSHTREHIFRAILEAVIYGFRHHVETLERHGLYAQRVFATNGGAKSKFWCQIAADVLGREVVSYPTHPGSAMGVAYLAAMAAGVFTSFDEIGRFLSGGVRYSPNPENARIYDKAYAVYRKAYVQLKGCFADLGNLY